MSEIKVNKISPRTNCGTVTLGDSGDTFTIPAGATITNAGTANGFGASGAISWQTSIKTTDFTAVSNEGYFVNTSGGSNITVTLPASPSAGNVVAIKDYARTFGTNKVILARNGSNMDGNADDTDLSTDGISVTLVFMDSTKGWSFINEDDTTQAGAAFVTATGGTISTCGNFKIHTFTGPGTFCVSCGGTASGSNTVDYLVVAGGGGAGGYAGSGGGGGGFRLANSTSMPAPLTSPLANPSGLPVPATAYPITVGGGGSGGAGNGPSVPQGVQGSTSSFSTISSAGGGGGHGFNVVGDSGGSGSGGRGAAGPSTSNPYAGGAGNTPSVSPPQGSNGGQGWDGVSTNTNGGGGGGAGAVGGNAASATGGVGGVGSFVVQSGFAGCNGTPGPVSGSKYFSGGGGGATDGANNSGAGGAGGGGAGGHPNAGVAGSTNTGGGGGGGGCSPSGGVAGGAGGSGLVIIRYKFQ
ncbi:glycine-rich domain-containing protein [Hyphomonas sp.]|uniref:glycine-rich domain-containing protein n=1 Tax=Hyphomonas sp. TaxID=87 RepID=UPI0025C65A51|nr:hypothetical protein [Hyphomonas sp.]